MRLQFAANGEWETSLHIASREASSERLQPWLDAAPSDIAFDVFLADATQREQFVGIRLAALSRAARHRFCIAALEFFRASGHRSAEELLFFIRTELAMPPLFASQPSFLELGVVNAWRTNGPVQFWTRTSPQQPYPALEQALDVHPRYRQAMENPIGIELGFSAPLPHWLGMVISNPQHDGHRIDLDVARELCERVAHDTGIS